MWLIDPISLLFCYPLIHLLLIRILITTFQQVKHNITIFLFFYCRYFYYCTRFETYKLVRIFTLSNKQWISTPYHWPMVRAIIYQHWLMIFIVFLVMDWIFVDQLQQSVTMIFKNMAIKWPLLPLCLVSFLPC